MAKAPTPTPVPTGTGSSDAAAGALLNDQDAANIAADSADAAASDPAVEAVGTVPARILVDHLHFRSGAFALLTEAEAADCAGWADLDEAAVAYAQAEAEGAA